MGCQLHVSELALFWIQETIAPLNLAGEESTVDPSYTLSRTKDTGTTEEAPPSQYQAGPLKQSQSFTSDIEQRNLSAKAILVWTAQEESKGP